MLYFGCSSNGASTSDETISLKAIAGVTAPVPGAAPVTTIAASQYSGSISWNPAVSSTFATSTVYTATINLTPKEGFTLSGIPANSFTVAGATANNKTDSGVITAVFPATGKEAENVIFSGVTQVGGVTNSITTTSLTLTFNADPTTLTKDNITVIGATAGALTGSGTTRTLAISGITVANGETVSVSVSNPSGFAITGSPKTAVVYRMPQVAITVLAIPDVIFPVRGATPVSTIDTAQYTGIVSWSGTPATFAATTAYTATIALTAKDGWTFTGVAANAFTVEGATTTNAVNTGTVTALFPKTLSFTLSMATVPAGIFQRDKDASNKSMITYAYRMSACEITRAQFSTIMGVDPSDTDVSGSTADPVQRTSWYHAIAFCNKLSIAEGLTPVYAVENVNFKTLLYNSIPKESDATWDAVTADCANNGYRLPTEMEWMWAAMGATSDARNEDMVDGVNIKGYNKGYAGSSETENNVKDLKEYAWYEGNTAKTQPVGGKTSNELGLYDMTGNVSEWNWDWFSSLPTLEQSNYQGPDQGTTRVIHGGNYQLAFSVRARSSYSPEEQDNCVGFRVVRL